MDSQEQRYSDQARAMRQIKDSAFGQFIVKELQGHWIHFSSKCDKIQELLHIVDMKLEKITTDVAKNSGFVCESRHRIELTDDIPSIELSSSAQSEDEDLYGNHLCLKSIRKTFANKMGTSYDDASTPQQWEFLVDVVRHHFAHKSLAGIRIKRVSKLPNVEPNLASNDRLDKSHNQEKESTFNNDVLLNSIFLPLISDNLHVNPKFTLCRINAEEKETPNVPREERQTMNLHEITDLSEIDEFPDPVISSCYNSSTSSEQFDETQPKTFENFHKYFYEKTGVYWNSVSNFERTEFWKTIAPLNKKVILNELRQARRLKEAGGSAPQAVQQPSPTASHSSSTSSSRTPRADERNENSKPKGPHVPATSAAPARMGEALPVSSATSIPSREKSKGALPSPVHPSSSRALSPISALRMAMIKDDNAMRSNSKSSAKLEAESSGDTTRTKSWRSDWDGVDKQIRLALQAVEDKDMIYPTDRAANVTELKNKIERCKQIRDRLSTSIKAIQSFTEKCQNAEKALTTKVQELEGLNGLFGSASSSSQ